MFDGYSKHTLKKQHPRHARYAAGASASSRDVNADGSQAAGSFQRIEICGNLRLDVTG